jgi:hypothetical protein
MRPTAAVLCVFLVPKPWLETQHNYISSCDSVLSVHLFSISLLLFGNVDLVIQDLH